MNTTSPGIGIVSISKRLSKIENFLEEKSVDIPKSPETFLDEIILEQEQKLKEKKIKEQNKIKEQYINVIRLISSEIKETIQTIEDNFTKILKATESAIKFVEINYEKIKYLYQIPLDVGIELSKSNIKLNIALEILKFSLDILFDRQTAINTINYLCSIVFPKNNNTIQNNTKTKKKKWYKTIKESIR